MILKKHAFLKPNVWNEYKEAMMQERYKVDSEKYKQYILKQERSGLSPEADVHYQTGLIIRKSLPVTEKIGEVWYEHIQEAGIECQISFFFIQ